MDNTLKRHNYIKQYNMINHIMRKVRILEVINHLDELLAPFYLNKDEYAIGGSYALILYGGKINRNPHDLDLIVTSSTLEKIKSIVAKSYFYTEAVTSSCDSEFGTKHFAVKTVKGPIIDFVAYDGQSIKDASIRYSFGTDIRVMDIAHCLNAKKMYNRPKDAEDLKELKRLYEELEHSSNSSNNSNSSDLDMLAALKAKMESDE